MQEITVFIKQNSFRIQNIQPKLLSFFLNFKLYVILWSILAIFMTRVSLNKDTNFYSLQRQSFYPNSLTFGLSMVNVWIFLIFLANTESFALCAFCLFETFWKCDVLSITCKFFAVAKEPNLMIRAVSLLAEH